MGFKGVCDTFLSPLRWSAERRTTTPVPSSKEGDYVGSNEIFSNLRLAWCKAADPWVRFAGLAVCRKREGVPLPRSGGGREGADAPAAPYKHRLAHDPGRQSRSGRAFRCVGVLGFTPSRFWALLAIQKCHLGDSRAIYAFAKGSAPPTGEMKPGIICADNPSGSLRSPPPFTQGSLWCNAAPLTQGRLWAGILSKEK